MLPLRIRDRRSALMRRLAKLLLTAAALSREVVKNKRGGA
jgi:hypothetical protein